MAVGVFLAGPGIVGSASALEQEGFTLSDTHPKVDRDYPALAVFNPAAVVADPNVDGCRTGPSDALIAVGLSFRGEYAHVITFAVHWQSGATNDLDVYFFSAAGEMITAADTAGEPEILNVAGLANGDYFLCVRNFSGANVGFRLNASSRHLSWDEGFTQSTLNEPGRSRPSMSRVESVTARSGATEPVAVPASDGPLFVRALDAGSHRAGEAQTSGERGIAWTISFIGVLSLIGVMGVALWIRRARP